MVRRQRKRPRPPLRRRIRLSRPRGTLSLLRVWLTKALEAGKQADLAGRASDEALAAAVEAEAMISEGNAQIASMKAAEQSLMSQALLALPVWS